VTAVVFSVAGIHLYHYSSQLLEHRDDVALKDAVELLRHQITEARSIEALRGDPHPLLDVALAQRSLLFAVRTPDGKLVVASSPPAESLPWDRSANGPISLSRISDLPDSAEKHARWASITVQVGTSPDRVQLIVAHRHAERQAILNAYGHDLLWTALVAALATGALGYGIARRGLRPVKTIARAAGDITASQLNERLRVEDAPAELEEMVRAFNRMLDRLEESFGRLQQFSSDIAHDLRTPLSNLMGETQVALTRPRSIAEYQALLGSNIEEFERLSRMIEDMLFLARVDNPSTVIKMAPVDVRAELDKVAEFYRLLAQERDLSIECDGQANVAGDRVLLQRAIHNLISNAVRYSRSGGTITVSITRNEDAVELSVTNQGAGIAGEHLPRVFDRFYRADSARQNAEEGTGLGLAIVKSIAQLHGGEIRVTSVAEQTTFVLRLPVSQATSTDV
jgi:two-component system heavy metal sensor histidine kinase CusS